MSSIADQTIGKATTAIVPIAGIGTTSTGTMIVAITIAGTIGDMTSATGMIATAAMIGMTAMDSTATDSTATDSTIGAIAPITTIGTIAITTMGTDRGTLLATTSVGTSRFRA